VPQPTPFLNYPDALPVVAHREEIIAAIRNHQVVVVVSETGSGKTTQLPKMVVEALGDDPRRIGCTQPRRLAAASVARRVAEELIFGKENITSGASSDIEQATRMARAMVTRLGYSDELGTVAYGDNNDEVFLGMSMGRQRAVSEATAQTIDAEVRRLVNNGQEDARRILTEKRDGLETVAKALLEYETLTGDEIIGLLAGRQPQRESSEPPSTPRSSTMVPSAGKTRKPGPDTPGGLEPQPLA
jgi:cell division protease FtsH